MLSILKGPYMQMPACDGVTVLWETSLEASSQVVIYPVGFSTAQRRTPVTVDQPASFEGSSGVRIHRVRVTGLERGTAYHYKVFSSCGDENVESPLHTLATAPGPGTPFCFAVTAETGGYGDPALSRRIFDQMKAYRPDILLMVGDVVADGNVYEDWSKYFFSPAASVLVDTPYYACLGNHEANARWFYAFNSFPEPKNYYSFDYADVHFTCLDSASLVDADHPQEHKMHPGEAQYDFLVRDLHETRAAWKVVFFHYPPYISADYEVPAMRSLCSLFERYGVDVVLSSHTIVYERSHPLRQGRLDEKGGVRYVVCGGAGAMPEWLRPKRLWHTAQSLAVPHFLLITVTPCTFELVAIDDQGRQFDRLRLEKGNELEDHHDRVT